MPVPSNWYAVVGKRLITFFDHVWLHTGVLRTRYLIAFARHKTAVETHCCRGSDDFSTVVSVVADANKVNHNFTILVWKNCWHCSVEVLDISRGSVGLGVLY